MTKNKSIPEILAPCGSYEILVAAVKAGTDACYIGGTKFGARAYAENLGTDSIIKAIDYAHCHNTSLYLTVNTLFKNNEIKELYDYLLPYYEAGLDAVIVQDLGVFSYVKKLFPDIAIHCSTQMNINSLHAARFMKEQGASRIVTAREMSLNEIKKIKENVDIEVETFVHGAMCYSYSGQCLMSSLAGGRSGNRGRCAQPCRKCYDGKYLLSMKDMCTLEHIPELIDVGIDSLKIEGRMKNEYYVASAVDAYHELCEDYIKNDFSIEKAKKYKFKLANIYNRGGFSDGYFFMHNGPDMISLDRPNNQGVCVGKFISASDGKIELKLEQHLYKGDVLELKLNNHEIIEITSGVEGKKGELVKLNAPKTKQIIKNQSVYRTRCNKILDETAKIIEESKKIPVKCSFNGIVGKEASFSISVEFDNKNFSYTAFGNVIEESVNRPAKEDDVKEKLMQMGDTNYYIAELDIKISDNSFIPASLVKNIRRNAVSGLEEAICNSYRRCVSNLSEENINTTKPFDVKTESELNIGVLTVAQLKAVIKYNYYNGIYMDRELYLDAQKEGLIDVLKSKNINIYVSLPYIIDSCFNMDEYLQNLDINGIYIRNIDGFSASLEHNTDEYKIIVGSSLYSYNNEAVGFIDTFIDDIIYELPKELNEQELRGLAHTKKELVIYEYQQVMLSAQCIRKTMSGCNKKNDIIKIIDDKGNVFYSRAVCSECCNVIYNGKPLYLFDKLTENNIRLMGISSFRINFTLETPDEINKILEDCKHLMDGQTDFIKQKDKYTTGHFNRGVD